MELKSWELGKEILWRPAATPAARWKAVDDLVAGTLEPGGIVDGHRTSLLFAAGEYERLSHLVTNSDPEASSKRQDLQEKARKLRKLAEEKDDRCWLDELVN